MRLLDSGVLDEAIDRMVLRAKLDGSQVLYSDLKPFVYADWKAWDGASQ